MSTSGSFTPAQVPECAYEPEMTRAAALALAVGGGLDPNCVVVVTDGPTIGAGGSTSPTTIELNPVSATAFGQAARVFTNFDNDAWTGLYDIGLNAITRLTDNRGNTVVDIDATAPTVHTQFPWGNINFRDNYVEDSTLPGWDAQVGTVANNRVVNSTVDLTGKTSGTIQDTTFQTAGVVLGAGGGAANMARSQIYGINPATVIISHTGTGSLSYNDVIQRDQFAVNLTGAGAFSAQDSTFSNHTNVTFDIVHAGGSALSFVDSTVVSPFTGAGFDVQSGTTGNVGVQRSVLNGCHVTKVAGSTGLLNLNFDDLTDCTVTIGAANAALANQINNVTGNQTSFNLQGPLATPARNDFINGVQVENATFTVAATATAGLNVDGGEYSSLSGGGVTQNRTAGTGSTSLFACRMRGFSTFTDNGTTDPGVATSFNRVELTDSTLTVGDVTGKTGSGPVLQQAVLMGSTLTLTGPNGAAFLNRVRLWGASLTNSGFDGSDLIIDGAFNKTMGATQSNKLCNKSFDDWV